MNPVIVITDPNKIKAYQYRVVISALKLERLGMKHSRVKNIRASWAKILGLKPRDSYDLYISAFEAKIKELLSH